MFLSKIRYFTINYNMNAVDNIKMMLQRFVDFFDFSTNQIFENETCIEIIELIIKIIGNIIIFIADANTDKSIDEKFMENQDHIYFFIERLFDIDKISSILIQNRKVSQDFRNDLIKLRIVIKNYFNLIRNRQNKCNFIKMETENIKYILYSNN